MREDPKFGTDGVRGLANDDLSADFAFRLGRTAGFVIGAARGEGRVLIGRDTRVSGDMLRCALTAGLLSVGAHVIDLANGAAYELAPRVLRELGSEVETLATEPDGMNINAGCGALHPETAQAAARDRRPDFAVSLDGDADRAIFTDERGRLVDGDRVMAICAIAWKDSDLLPGNQVVGTVMSNLGPELGLRERGIRLL